MKFDGLKLMLKAYDNQFQLDAVEKATGISIDKLKSFINGDNQFTEAEEKRLREDCKEFGGEVEVT